MPSKKHLFLIDVERIVVFTLNIGIDNWEQTMHTQIKCHRIFAFLFSSTSTGIKMDLFKFKDKYSKEFRFPSI